MDDLPLVIETACRLPIDYEQLRDRSAVDLVRRSGLASRLDELSVERIHACLQQHPDWIDAWIHWSEDQRSRPAWYVIDRGPGLMLEVGYLDLSGFPRDQEQFADRTRACATFVDHELRAIAQLV